MTRQSQKKYCYLTENKSSSIELKSFLTLQISVSKWVSASLAIAFCLLSSHFKNSKSSSGYPCKLKQILVDFLRAFSRGKFLSGCWNFRRTLLELSRFSKWPSEHEQAVKKSCNALPNMVIYVYRWISVMYGSQILRASWPYMGIVTICWIINQARSRGRGRGARAPPEFLEVTKTYNFMCQKYIIATN